MKTLAVVLCFGALALAAAPVTESLHYEIKWPSGLSLGDVLLASSTGDAGRTFDMQIDASVPGFPIREHYHSSADAKFCSAELTKDAQRGKRKIDETTTFDQAAGTAVRKTGNGGGESKLSIAYCAKDALTYFAFVRRELSQGRLAPPQTVWFGAPYQVRLDYGGTQAVIQGDRRVDGDRVIASIKGPVAALKVDLVFARDAARTPLSVKVPLSAGVFTMDLVTQ